MKDEQSDKKSIKIYLINGQSLRDQKGSSYCKRLYTVGGAVLFTVGGAQFTVGGAVFTVVGAAFTVGQEEPRIQQEEQQRTVMDLIGPKYEKNHPCLTK